jgi:hypothetical protein
VLQWLQVSDTPIPSVHIFHNYLYPPKGIYLCKMMYAMCHYVVASDVLGDEKSSEDSFPDGEGSSKEKH